MFRVKIVDGRNHYLKWFDNSGYEPMEMTVNSNYAIKWSDAYFKVHGIKSEGKYLEFPSESDAILFILRWS